MKEYPQNMIKNICITGHGSDGKTTFTEALLFTSKAIDRPGNIAAGTTCSDYGTEEIKRKISISTSICPVEWKGLKINVIDTPGFFDFVGETLQGIKATDTSLILLSGKSGINVGTEKVFDYGKEKPRAFMISHLDEEDSHFFKVLDELTQKFGAKVCPASLPIIDGEENLLGYIDLIENRALDTSGNSIDVPASEQAALEDMRNRLMEAIAGTDEELMEKFFEGEEFTKEEIYKGLKAGMEACEIFPVFAGSATDLASSEILLDAIVSVFPAPDYTEIPAKDADEKDIMVAPSENDPFSAIVFKTIADPFVGKMSYFRIISGSLSADKQIVNGSNGQVEKIGRIFVVTGKKQEEVPRLHTGDIGVVTKLANTNTGDTLCEASRIVNFEKIQFPKPALSLAIVPAAKGDEEKISSGLQKLSEEDPTFEYYINKETHQQIISGVGDNHLDVVISKLKNKFGTAVTLKTPKVPYRETIRKKVKVEGKHKKQSGGHGQFGHVWIEFEPGQQEDLEFCEQIFGGSVPKNFFPAVEKGLRDCISKGVIAGYPVVNLKATLVDGSYHPVDSSEMAFKVAASLAYKAGLAQASPALLEPIGTLKTYVPESLMGAIIGDINKRRGQVLGMNPVEGDIQEIVGEVPMAEMHTYATDLRSMTRGRGYFDFEFTRYQEAPANIAQKVIEEAAKRAED